MKILYQFLSPTTIYAGRTIYNGYKNAFTDLGHEFRPFTADDNFGELLDRYQPDIFFTGLSAYSLRYLDLEALNRHRQRGLKVFVNVPFWVSPLSKLRINETSGLKGNAEFCHLIKERLIGDFCFNSCEQDDGRMSGFEEALDQPYYTIPLAADKTIMKESFDAEFQADISYLGTNLPEKRPFFEGYVLPLKSKYDVRLYGQDWTLLDRGLGWVQRFGQYFNIGPLARVQKPKLQLGDEAKIYTSSRISINVHEEFQRRFGGDCNERTFKIPLCGGFEIVDDVSCIRKYFTEGEEITIARNPADWLEKIDYYIKNLDKRAPIVAAGQRRVLKDHTYHNRVARLLEIAQQ